MRHSLWLIALFAAQAHATFLQFDIETPRNAINLDRWALDIPPGDIDVSFILDTSNTAFSSVVTPGDQGGSCFAAVDFAIQGRILDVSIGGQTLVSGLSGGTGTFSGDRPNACHDGSSQAFFAGFGLAFDNGFRLQLIPDSSHQIAVAEVFASDDPIAALLLAGRYVGFMFLIDGDQEGATTFDNIAVHKVPEPATLGVFALSLAMTALFRRVVKPRRMS